VDHPKTNAGTPWVPAPLSQVGDYKLDLLKFSYFSWINAATIATEFWLQQLATMIPETD
jgi:hypothetical protein